MIAITFAIRAESRRFVVRLRKAKTPDEVVVVHTGVGRARCQAEIEKFLSCSHPKFLVSSGFAGAVSDQLQPGDLVIGRNFSDPELLSAALRIIGPEARPVTIMTTDTVINSAAQRNKIASANADAVDMESEVIANACRSRNIPVLSMRAISDSATRPLPLPPEILFDLTKQKTDFMKLGGYLLAHPTAVWRLSRFSRQINRARDNLASALLKVVDSLGDS